jgi:hypothetical protein
MKTSIKIALVLLAYALMLPVLQFLVAKLNSWGVGISFDDAFIASLIGVIVYAGMIWGNRSQRRS